MSINRKRGSIALARQLCYEIAGAANEYDDFSGSEYGSVDVAEILSAEIVRLREALAQPAQEPVECLDCGSHNIGIPATYDSLVNSVKAQPAQEPVDIASIIACRDMLDAQPVSARVQYMIEDDDDIQDYKKPWVNLTDDEIALIHASHPQEFARALMAKLKERNS